MNMLRKWSAITLACVIAASMVLLAGCAEKSNQSQSEYADEAFIQSLEKGYEARDTLVGQSSKTEKSAEYYEKLVDAELEQVEQYQSAQFSDSKLQENAIAYINALKDQRAAAELYATDNSKYKQDWQKAYDKRTALLKTFVDNYGFAVSPEHQDSLDKLVSHGKKVERDNNQKEAIESLASSINLDLLSGIQPSSARQLSQTILVTTSITLLSTWNCSTRTASRWRRQACTQTTGSMARRSRSIAIRR